MTATRKQNLNVSFNPRVKTHLKSSDSTISLCKLPLIEKVLGRFSPISHLHHTHTPTFCAGSLVKPRLQTESNELIWHFETHHQESHPPTPAHQLLGHTTASLATWDLPGCSSNTPAYPADSPAAPFLQGAYKFFSI